jgi:hypothetical protein
MKTATVRDYLLSVLCKSEHLGDMNICKLYTATYLPFPLFCIDYIYQKRYPRPRCLLKNPKRHHNVLLCSKFQTVQSHISFEELGKLEDSDALQNPNKTGSSIDFGPAHQRG